MKYSVSFKNTHSFYILIQNCSYPNQGHFLLLLLQFIADTQVYVPVRVTMQMAPGSRSLLPPCPYFPQWMSNCSKDCPDFYVLEVKQKCVPTCVCMSFALFLWMSNLTQHSLDMCVIIVCYGSPAFYPPVLFFAKSSWFLYFLCLVISSWFSVKSLLVKIVLIL